MKSENIFQGHEIWLEPAKKYYHKGEKAVVKIGWGHAMKTDGLCEKEKCNAYILTPDNKTIQLPIVESEKDYHIVSFKMEDEGIYVVALEYNYGIGTKLKDGSFTRGPKKDYENVEYSTYFYQYAKSYILTINHIEIEALRDVGHVLEMIPLNNSHFLQLKAIYEGKPSKGVTIDAVYKNHGKKEYPITATTDQSGVGSISLGRNDLWMFRIRKIDETKKISNFYDKTNITATLTISIEQ